MEPAGAIERFEIVSERASGATGKVYEAIDTTSGERVALKVIRRLSRADGERFLREARTLSQIRHPGVVRYVDHGHTEDGHAYLAMEWLDGEDLRSRLDRAISIRETVTLGGRVAEALAAIHEHGLVHRDLKPANIFLPGGRVESAKVIDFGIIRAVWDTSSVTLTGAVVGTPSYMAPEQAQGQRDIDVRADVFSLGCVLFKCLTGRAPFEGTSSLAVLGKVVLEEAPALHALRPEVPPALEALVMRMLRKDVAERPRALAVADALAALADAEDLGDTHATLPPSSTFSKLTAGEQRVTAVVLVGPATLPTPGGEPALSAGTAAPKAPPAARLHGLVERYGGRLDGVIEGTQIVTIASAGPATDQAGRAARCALAIRAAHPAAPIAVASCWSEVRPHGPGKSVERATLLLEALAGRETSGPAPIAIDDATAALLGPRFEVAATSGGGLRLLGIRGASLGAHRLLGRTVPMVGRDWELTSIEQRFRACVDEREASVVLVTGAPGMGKSRLAHEAVTRIQEAFTGAAVWWGRADPLRAGSALGLLGQLVRDAAGVVDGLPLDERRHRFAERIAAWVHPAEATGVAEVLGEIAGVPFCDEASPALRAARQDARLMSERTRAAWEALVSAASDRRPLLVVLEDLQWADAATVRLVGSALAGQGQRPWMVLALARPEAHATVVPLWEGRRLQEIRLRPLTRRAAERLAREALGPDAGAETLAWIAARCDGNAFYLEELIRAVARGGPRSALPDTVLAMVQARLDGLGAETRRALRAASVFGEVFWEGGVAALLGAHPVEGWVETLVALEIVEERRESRFANERELAFRHALVREGAYATLTPDDRALGHALAATWREQHGEADAMVLAQHFELAGDEAEAARFYTAAGHQALRAGDAEAAVARAERALPRLAAAARVECLSLLCEALAWRAAWDRVNDVAGEVTGLAPAGSVPWIRAMSWKQTASMMVARPDAQLAASTALVGVEGTPETAPALAMALMVTVFILCGTGHFATARRALARLEALARVSGEGDARPALAAAQARTWIAAWADDDAWAALRHAREALAGWQALSDVAQARFARVFVGMCLGRLGRLSEGEAELRAVAGGEDMVGMMVGLYLSQVLLDAGALDEVRALAERRIALGRGLGAGAGALRRAQGEWLLGEVLARAGAYDEAEAMLSACLPALRVQWLPWHAARGRLAEVRLSRGDVAGALALARDVDETQRGSGGGGLRGPLSRLVLADALHAAGRVDEAREAIGAAHGDLMARAARIEDAEVRAQFLSAVPEHARLLSRARAWLGAGGA